MLFCVELCAPLRAGVDADVRCGHEESPQPTAARFVFEDVLSSDGARTGKSSVKNVASGKYCGDEGDKIRCNRDTVGKEEKHVMFLRSDNMVRSGDHYP